MEKLDIDLHYEPCLIEENDEYMPNGIFVFNITKMKEYARISENNISVVDHRFSSFDTDVNLEEYKHGSIVTSNPGIIAEISPGLYNLIDGRHRATKIKQKGGITLKCFQFDVMDHINFLTSVRSYKAYIEYWNSKVASLMNEK